MRMEQTKVDPESWTWPAVTFRTATNWRRRLSTRARTGARCWSEWFHREIDLGDSYVTLNHSIAGSQPAQTILVYGRKGEVDGDFRTDETEMLVLRADGTVQRTEQTVKTWLKYDAIRDALARSVSQRHGSGANRRRDSQTDSGQCEGINSVDPARRMQLRSFTQQHAVQQAIAGHHRDVLFSIHRVGDGAHRNGSAQDRFPKLLARRGVVGAEAAIQIALKKQAACSNQSRAIGRRAARH